MDLKLDAAAVTRLIEDSAPDTPDWKVDVQWVKPGGAMIRQPFREGLQRAGEVMSGPSLMSAADTAMYVCVLAHIGPQVMAVTVDMNLQFLRPAAKGDLFAEAWVLKLGRRRAALRVMVRDHLGNEACHVTGTYAWPTPL
ncbi:PaaI family thioesterase [Polycyclovorans algicola]|uniref:PaaI family thioesterase n=1 Tax=Polycyclovorans algicola TaxID=616992 RepID=UPI0005BB357C|nr:PaaI family thioesterase [Polycyclovorans algicola]